MYLSDLSASTATVRPCLPVGKGSANLVRILEFDAAIRWVSSYVVSSGPIREQHDQRRRNLSECLENILQYWKVLSYCFPETVTIRDSHERFLQEMNEEFKEGLKFKRGKDVSVLKDVHYSNWRLREWDREPQQVTTWGNDGSRCHKWLISIC